MSGSLQLALANVLKDVSASVSRYPEKSVSLFSGQRGSNYTGELLVVGRAVNGYDPAFDPASWVDEQTRDRDIQQTMGRDGRDGLTWVTGLWAPQKDADGNRTYSTGRSAFWRVLRGISARLGIADPNSDWATHLAWTNLYKVAPVVTGNPSAGLARQQQAAACGMIACELDFYAPKRVLFLTGTDWFDPFASEVGFSETRKPTGRLVQRIGRVRTGKGSADAVIARHPQGKPEEVFIAEVCDAFGQPSKHYVLS